MASIDELVEATIARLKSAIRNATVEAFPDDPKQYRFIDPVAALLVRYGGSHYPEEGVRANDSFVYQDRHPILEVRILTRSLTGANGAGAFLDAVRVRLTGWKPPDGQRAYVVAEDFDRYDDKNLTWQHSLTFAAQAVWTETPEEEQEPLLKRLTYLGSSNQTEVP